MMMSLSEQTRETWPADESGTTDFVGDGGESTFQLRREHSVRVSYDTTKSVDKASSVSSLAYSLSDMSLSESETERTSGTIFLDQQRKDSQVDNLISRDTGDTCLTPNSNQDTPSTDLQFLSSVGGRFKYNVPSFCKAESSFDMEYDQYANSSITSTISCYPLNMTDLPASTSLIQEFDFIKMKEKLEAQKEFLCQSFDRQLVLPQALALKSLPQTGYKPKKSASLKLKVKLHKLGKAARHFWSTRVLRHQPSLQRCEIYLHSFDDRVECFILAVSLRSAGSGSGRSTSQHHHHISMPSAFETNRVLVPRCLLPSRPGDAITVTVCGITAGQEEGGPLSDFKEIVVSGTCTIQFDSRSLVSDRVELQPHRPGHSLAGISKTAQSGGTCMETTHSDPDDYAFFVHPSPVASDFTELCILQKADPFREYLALSSSTCNQPAAFRTSLTAGQYYAVCCCRLTVSTREVFAVSSATPTAFFKANMNKAKITELMNQAADRAAKESIQKPVPCPTLLLLKPPGLDVQGLMQIISNGQAQKPVSSNTAVSPAMDEALHLCAWDMESADTETKSWHPFTTGWSAVQNPRLPAGSREYTRLPSLSVFNLSTRLYFADYWSYYDKHFVTLVLCAKGSPCHQVCKRRLPKVDPYNNPFLFRRRFFDPEPSVAVYALAGVRVEVVHSNSVTIERLVSACSENVFFSKVRVEDTALNSGFFSPVL